MDDAATVAEDAAATAIDVLANDTDADGGPQAGRLGHAARQRHGGDHRRRHGLTYQPTANYCNDRPSTTDTFTYTLTGGSTATVS